METTTAGMPVMKIQEGFLTQIGTAQIEPVFSKTDVTILHYTSEEHKGISYWTGEIPLPQAGGMWNIIKHMLPNLPPWEIYVLGKDEDPSDLPGWKPNTRT
jgi:hypothetical protein